MKVLLLIFTAVFPILAQNKFDFNSQSNVKLFADHLFCDKDYLRAAEEYQKLSGDFLNDTIIFKTGLSYYFIGEFTEAGNNFSRIRKSSALFDDAQLQKAINGFRQNPEQFYNYYTNNFNTLNPEKFNNALYKLKTISLLLTGEQMQSKEEFFQPFNQEEKKVLSKYFNWKNDSPYKNPLTAGILSAVIPGAGKIYTEEYSDGILAFLATGLLTFLAYDNFNADHKIRGWIFASLASLFYAGNIYGSIAAVQIFNARINFEFKDGINFFLEKNNYFMPQYDFCK